MNILSVILFALIAFSVLFAGSESDTSSERFASQSELTARPAIPPTHLRFLRACDTVYVTGDRFIEVSLEKQTLLLRYRNGSADTFRISSGNKLVKDGIETPEGIFTVQSKSPMAISKQFDDAKLHWWIGFNGNIGFHGLDGNSYYRFLGKRASSHGCVRMAREEIAELYKKVSKGTPVVLYKSQPSARILAFADTNDFSGVQLASRNDKSFAEIMNKRLEMLYQGKFYTLQRDAVYLDGKTILRPGGYSTGDFSRISFVQEKPLFEIRIPARFPSDRFLSSGVELMKIPADSLLSERKLD